MPSLGLVDEARFFFRRFTATFLLNILFHCLQISALALVVVCLVQNKPLASIPDGTLPDLLSLKFNLLPSWIFKLYGILLVSLTQTLALQRDSLVKQTLTNIHDKTYAWMGEPKAAIALVKQSWFRSRSFWRIGGIFLYLLSITILSASGSSIVTYVSVPGEATYLNITAFIPNITAGDIGDAYPILGALSVMDVWGLIGISGVWNNIIFDPPNYQSAVVHHVAAVQYDVNCQALPNAKQSDTVKVITDNNETSITYPFRVDDRLRDVEFGVGDYQINIIDAQPTNNASGDQVSTLLVASTIPISDINGDAQSKSMLNPPLARPNCTEDSNTNCLSQAEIQILACDLVVINRTIAVDAAYGAPVHEQQLLSQLNNTWDDWAGPFATPASGSLQDTLSQFATLSPWSNTENPVFLDSNVTGIYVATLLEEAVMDLLKVWDIYDPSDSIQLYDLNLALGRALAMVYWRAAVGLAVTNPNPAWFPNSTSKGIPRDTWQIMANSFTPYLALVTSVLATIFSVILTWPAPNLPPRTLKEQPTGLGVLQMFWRAGNLKGGQEAAALAKEDPDVDNLREVGKKIEVSVGESSEPSSMKSEDRPSIEDDKEMLLGYRMAELS